MASKRSGFVSIVKEYSQETAAHAIPRVGDSGRKAVARIVWAILFLVSTAFCIFQIYDLITGFLDYPKNVEVNLEFRAIPFPAVTICSVNPFIPYKINPVNHVVARSPR